VTGPGNPVTAFQTKGPLTGMNPGGPLPVDARDRSAGHWLRSTLYRIISLAMGLPGYLSILNASEPLGMGILARASNPAPRRRCAPSRGAVPIQCRDDKA